MPHIDTKLRAAELEASPYRLTSYQVHDRLLRWADNDTRIVKIKHKTLAERIKCGVRTVARALSSMVKDGYLEVVRKCRTYIEYRLILSIEVRQNGRPWSAKMADHDLPKWQTTGEGEQEREEEVKSADASASAPEQDGGMALTLGGFDPVPADFDGPAPSADKVEKTRRPDPPIALVKSKWERRMMEIGVRRWNRGHLHAVLRTLATDHTWEQVEQIMLDFIDQEAESIKEKQGRYDPVQLFHQALNRGSDQVRYPTRTVAAAREVIGSGVENDRMAKKFSNVTGVEQ